MDKTWYIFLFMRINEAGWCTLKGRTCVWVHWRGRGQWSHLCSDNIKDNSISPTIIATARPWRTESVRTMLKMKYKIMSMIMKTVQNHKIRAEWKLNLMYDTHVHLREKVLNYRISIKSFGSWHPIWHAHLQLFCKLLTSRFLYSDYWVNPLLV